jgi:riboflavin biosynthesis pyrimidine reductase
MWIRANLVLGASGQTTFEGNSKALSSRFDRTRFHNIRSECQVILIGGETARREPYAKTPTRLIILSSSGEIPDSVRANPLAEIWNVSPQVAISKLKNEGVERVLIEAGRTMILHLAQLHLLDGIYITQTNSDIGENSIDVELITQGMKLVSAEDSDGESFFFYSK